MADLFNEKSKDWDTNDIVARLSSAVGASILANIPLHEQMQVMDFGAGTGLISSQIAPRVKKIFAVDTSAAMLDKLVSKPELQDKVEAVCQNIIDKPMDKKVDLIVSAMALHHVKDTAGLIQRFAEHLNPQGLLALADLDKEDGSFHPADTEGVFHHGFVRSELQAMLEKQGFGKVNFLTAHTINKEEKSFPVFLLTAEKI